MEMSCMQSRPVSTIAATGKPRVCLVEEDRKTKVG